MKKVTEYEIVDHGIEYEQYFQGCGVSFTKFETVATGIGNSLQEALNDAVEGIAQQGYEIPNELEQEINKADNTNHAEEGNETEHTDCGDDDCFSADVHYYASIRVK